MDLINSDVPARAVAKAEDRPPTIVADLCRQRRSRVPETSVRSPRPGVEGSTPAGRLDCCSFAWLAR